VVEPKAVDKNVVVQKFELPAPKGAVKMIPADQMTDLVNRLKTEAKVL